MQGTPYRYREPAAAPSIVWWAGGVGKACAALAVVAWIATFGLAYQRESWGVAGAEVAAYPTGFAVGCLVLARRTRYRSDRAARVAAPLAAGLLGGWIALLAILLFFGAVWSSL